MATKPKLIPFRPEHLVSTINRDSGQRESVSLGSEQAQHGLAFTGVLGDRILGCAGIVMPWPGIGMAWMVLSEDIGGHSVWMTRMVKGFMRDVVRCYNLHRIEAVVLSDNVRNQRWIERLGFSRENGAARQYTPDRKDMIRYERLVR